MSSEQAILAVMAEDVRQRLAPVVATFNKVIASIETGQRLLPPAENIASYTIIYNIATDQRYDSEYQHASKKLSELLYSNFQEMLSTYARHLSQTPTTEDKFAKVHAWAKFRTASRWACVVFRYLGCFFLNDTKGGGKYPPLDDVARAVFYNCCLKRHLAETRRAVFDLISSARDGDQINIDILKSSVDLFERMSIPSQPAFFEEQFLAPFADVTRDYYDHWAAARVTRFSAGEYIQHCGRTLHSESERFRLLFSARHHRARLLDEVESALLDHRSARELIFKSPTGLRSLLRRREFDTANVAFKLLSTKKKRIEPIAEIVGQQLEEDGRAQLEARRAEVDLNPYECVTELYNLNETYTKLLHDHFANNITIARAIQGGLEKIMSEGIRMAGAEASGGGSRGVISISEILALYCDYCIRQQDKILTPLEECFDKAISLLVFTANKDLFQIRARELLAKRLLTLHISSSINASETAEQLLVSKLKRACGSQFTSHYDSMLADRHSSCQLQTQFVNYLSSTRIQTPTDFCAMVLKIGIWPLKADENILTIPREVALCIKHYIDFYKSSARTARCVLKWLHGHSTAVLTARYVKGAKELSMTAYQAGVLLAFNKATPQRMLGANPSGQESAGRSSPMVSLLSVKEMQQATNLSEDQVRRAVGGLCRAKVLLLASPQHHVSMGAAPGSIFFANDQFAHPSRKIAVPSVVPKGSAVSASEALQNQADEARRPTIQACLVKIMKSRRQISHQELVGDAMRFLSNHFVPEPSAIKEQIGALIERDIIKRHPTQQGVYVYVA